MITTARTIIESIPLRFRPEKALHFNTTFHFDISDDKLQYTVRIHEGNCELEKGLNGVADCVVRTNGNTYVDLETGKANPQMALMMGKVKVSNIAAMMQFAKCFRKFDPAVNYSDQHKQPSAVKFKERVKLTGPLSGVKILDFTRLLPGPLATMFLADMGAEVWKVEDPDNPDYIRDFEPRISGMSMFYLSLNRNKRSMALNYLSSAGKTVLYDLVKQCDVLVEQYRPGVMKDMGLGYEQLSAINPRLIYVSITGYGQNSTKAMHAGHDLNYVALSGGLGITGDAEKPSIPGFQLADIAGGSYMAMNAIMAALYQREKTGNGEWIDVAMTDAALPLNVLQFALHHGTKHSPQRGTFELSGGLANYNVYKCKDGLFIALGSLEPKFWNRFCARVNRNDWTSRFLGSPDEIEILKNELRNLFLTKSRSEWIEYFKEDDICITEVKELHELERDIYLNERQMFLENEHPAVGKYKTINQPLKFLSSRFENNTSAPDLGDDSAGILKEIGYDEKNISELISKNVIKVSV